MWLPPQIDRIASQVYDLFSRIPGHLPTYCFKRRYSFGEVKLTRFWSGYKFCKTASKIIPLLEARGVTIHYYRNRVELDYHGQKILCHVHYRGRTNDFLTLTSEFGDELVTFHHTDLWETIYFYVLQSLDLRPIAD